jgi:hypothetical protein
VVLDRIRMRSKAYALMLLRLVCRFVEFSLRYRRLCTLHVKRRIFQRMDRQVALYREEMRQTKLSEASRLLLRLEQGSQ